MRFLELKNLQLLLDPNVELSNRSLRTAVIWLVLREWVASILVLVYSGKGLVMINNELCDKFSVGHYPMLLWAPPNKFVAGGWKPNQDKSEIRAIDDGQTTDRLLNWINKQMGSSFGLDDQKYENEHL
ncbi:Sulfhydryl oxidase 2 [Camellia lanceoleosa]|uniref:Sulfhydryl oxidase 2 n=1 Tax=Camellia lanceoleosa TaxID=1840588 RepID=A0ACC0G3L2_9ERIC|nr:Sulfhydryl oxidase 2 [Camellia lanceoleosa]